MAQQLDISQAAYTKIEKSETKFSFERLFKIAEILEVAVNEVLDIDPNNTYNQNNNDTGTFIGQQEVQNLYQENKEKTEKIEILYIERLNDKDILINQLQNIINHLTQSNK